MTVPESDWIASIFTSVFGLKSSTPYTKVMNISIALPLAVFEIVLQIHTAHEQRNLTDLRLKLQAMRLGSTSTVPSCTFAAFLSGLSCPLGWHADRLDTASYCDTL